MDAIVIGATDMAEIDLDRCIGCGLCVNVCPEEAIHLELKPENERLMPPETGVHTFMEIAKRRQASSASNA